MKPGRTNEPLPPFSAEDVKGIADAHAEMEGALLPILHAINDRYGYVDERAIPVVADALNLTRAEVHGVVTFYHDFRREPAKRHVIKVCRAEACQSLGGERLYAEIRAAAAESGADVTVEPVYCLGNCALSPAAMIDGKLYGRMTTEGAMARVRA